MLYISMFFGVILNLLGLNTELLPEGQGNSTSTATNTESVSYEKTQPDSQSDSIAEFETTLHQRIDLNSEIKLIRETERNVVTTEDIRLQREIDNLKVLWGYYEEINSFVTKDVDKMEVEIDIKSKSKMWYLHFSWFSLIVLIICTHKKWSIGMNVFGIILIVSLLFTFFYLPDIITNAKVDERSIIYSILRQ